LSTFHFTTINLPHYCPIPSAYCHAFPHTLHCTTFPPPCTGSCREYFMAPCCCWAGGSLRDSFTALPATSLPLPLPTTFLLYMHTLPATTTTAHLTHTPPSLPGTFATLLSLPPPLHDSPDIPAPPAFHFASLLPFTSLGSTCSTSPILSPGGGCLLLNRRAAANSLFHG